jgi:hypothetical protein
MVIELRDFTIYLEDELPVTVMGRIVLREDGKVEFPASFPPESADKILAAFMRFVAARTVGGDVDARRALFTEATGLHGCFTPRSRPEMWETMCIQRDKINGLKQQMREMKRGYERKIARLEKESPAIRFALANSVPKTYSYKITAEGAGESGMGGASGGPGGDSHPMTASEKMGFDAQRAGVPPWGWSPLRGSENRKEWLRGWDRAAATPKEL